MTQVQQALASPSAKLLAYYADRIAAAMLCQNIKLL